MDGNWSETNSFKDVNRGVWTGEGNSCLLVFEGYTFDAQGKHSGKLQVRATVELRDNDHLAARWTQDMIDLQGKVTGRANYGTFEGTRMALAGPETASAAALAGGRR